MAKNGTEGGGTGGERGGNAIPSIWGQYYIINRNKIICSYLKINFYLSRKALLNKTL
jgi:hypothetical protein